MKRGKERGQATVELALVLPLIVVFLLAVVQVALVANARLLVSHAAREGARAAAVHPTSAVAAEAARGSLGVPASRLTVALAGGTAEGDQLAVTVIYRVPTNVPLVGMLVGDIDVSATVTMRVEHQ
ncbi:MAG: pilus assembly protein [Acidimicrobiales bacterium]